MSLHYRSPRSRALLSIFLADHDVGIDLTAVPGGWRLSGFGLRGGRVSVNVTRPDPTAEPQCSCHARRLPCKHVQALAAVGLLGGAETLTPRS